ncbi:MurR/RpiR family transcriptional regulator [Flexivirga caeni]|uniref:MurR/RpiR family transcriptional regulator n=1 Tax=Flexivirga caeni TaxID=2294115 RepID=UPI0013150EED|nr:MurR/RpiR family transcriptional regulator [Flexivirga caeni]
MTDNLLARVRAQAPSLGGAERAVAQVILDRADDIIELSSAQVAALAGVSRPTVVRTCQSLGLTGYQQLRVLLAREGVATAARRPPAEPADGPRAAIVATFRHVAASVDAMVALLTDEAASDATELLATARRLIVVGHGMSAPLALDAAARLNALGRVTEHYQDLIGEHIAVSGLGAQDAVFLVSGSGSNRLSLAAARAARDTGTRVLALTAFSHAPLVELADVTLVTGMPEPSFRDEIEVTSRIPQTILLEGLLAAVSDRLGDTGRAAKARSVHVVSGYLEE